jgi:hypothetical protein
MIVWKNVDMINSKGKLLKEARQVILPFGSGELLLRQILSMPRHGKKIISLAEATTIARNFVTESVMEYVPGFDCKTFRDHYIAWLSEQGYRIVLEGTEYQLTKELPLQ